MEDLHVWSQMIRNEFELSDMKWIDIVEPTKSDLTKFSAELGLPLRPLLNCLDPEHLPKIEIFENLIFIILRIFDSEKKPNADTVEELTTKLAIFTTPKFIVTIHRMDASFVKNIRLKLIEAPRSLSSKELQKAMIHQSILTFDHPLTEIEKKSLDFEEHIFSHRKTDRLLKEGYFLKRRASAYKKILKFSVDIMNKLIARPEYSGNDFQDIRETADRLMFYTDDVLENVSGLLGLHFSLASHRINEASHRTNEIMRVLTVFSIFFLPLNFIAGLYGMNFENMPELKSEWGYWIVLSVMGFISLAVFGWVWKKGWLHSAKI